MPVGMSVQTPFYHFHQLYEDLDISRAFASESSRLHILTGLEAGTFEFREQVAKQ